MKNKEQPAEEYACKIGYGAEDLAIWDQLKAAYLAGYDAQADEIERWKESFKIVIERENKTSMKWVADERKLQAERDIYLKALEFYAAYELTNAKIGMPISEPLVREFHLNGATARQAIEEGKKFR